MAEIIEHTSTENLSALRTRANSANALGIIGTALGGISLLGGLGTILGLGTKTGGGDSSLATKQWQDYISITKEYYNGELAKAEQRFNDRSVLNEELFNLYNWNRNQNDSINEKIDHLASKVDVMAAVRPYQDQLISNQIQMAADQANFNLFKRTAYCINGQVTLPDASITAIPGYYPPVF